MAQLNDLLVLGETKLLNPLSVESGGTGADNPEDALKNLNIVNEFGGVNIGDGADAKTGGAVGKGAKTANGGAVGALAVTNNGGAVGASSTTTSGGAVGFGAYSNSGGAVGEGAITKNGGAVGQSATSINGFAGGIEANVKITRDFSIAYLFSEAESINIDEDISSFTFVLPEKIFKIYNIKKIFIFKIEEAGIYDSFISDQITYEQNERILEIRISRFLLDITMLDSLGFIILGESNGDYAYSNNEIEIVTDFYVDTSNKRIDFTTKNPDPIKEIILYSNTDIASSFINAAGQHLYQATINLETINFENIFLNNSDIIVYLNSSNELIFNYNLSYNQHVNTTIYNLKKGDFYKIEVIREPTIEAGGAAVGAYSSAIDGFAGGQKAKSLALGAVQLGEGQNTEKQSLQFRNIKIIDQNGYFITQNYGEGDPPSGTSFTPGSIYYKIVD